MSIFLAPPRNLITFEVFDLEEGLRLINQQNNQPYIYNEYSVKTNSNRLRLFIRALKRAGSVKCCKCGISANAVTLDKYIDQGSPHFNVVRLKGDKRVLFTQDHIVPRSRGGLDSLGNLQVMCQDCNSRKGNKV